MDGPTIDRRLQQAEDLVGRMEKNIVFQRQMIATLDRGGHDVRAAKMFLRRLEATHANTPPTGSIVQGTCKPLRGLPVQLASTFVGGTPS